MDFFCQQASKNQQINMLYLNKIQYIFFINYVENIKYYFNEADLS
jgi:hypothetical protein